MLRYFFNCIKNLFTFKRKPSKIYTSLSFNNHMLESDDYLLQGDYLDISPDDGPVL